MNKIVSAGIVAVVSALASFAYAQEAPQAPTPQKEHEWLAQLAGEWDVETEAMVGPDEPATKCSGVQNNEILGGLWLISRGEAEMMGQPVTSILTIGYDPAKKAYVGTFVASCQDMLWTYEGKLNETKTKLILTTKGPSLTGEGGTAQYREAIEIKNKDHYVFTSSILQDGKWVQFATANYRRKK